MRNSFIEVFVDCVDRACRFASPVTTSRIREELLRQQPDYLDFIFFSANNGELYLYSTNDTINETPIYALSLFQTKKFKTQVPQLEEQIANLEYIADQNQVLKQKIQDKTIQISQLEEKLQSTEDKLNQLQVSNRTENLNIYTEQLNSYKNQIEQLDGQNYEMKWKIKDLEDQISSLMSEKIQYSQKLNIVNIDLNNVRRSYQFLQESQNQINRQSNDQTLVQVRDLEKIKIDLSNMTLEHENLQERIKIYENHNQQCVLENQTLKQQLIDANNLQQLMQEKENEIQDLKLKVNSNNRKLEELQVKENEIQDLKLKVNSNNRKLEELQVKENEIEDLKLKVNSNNRKLEELQVKENEIEDLKLKVNSNNRKLEELQVKENEIEDLKLKVNSNNRKLEELQQQNLQLQEKVTQTKNLKYDQNKANNKIMELEKQSEQRLKQLQEKEIQMNKQNDIKIEKLNQQHQKQLLEMKTQIKKQEYQIQQQLKQNKSLERQEQEEMKPKKKNTQLDQSEKQNSFENQLLLQKLDAANKGIEKQNDTIENYREQEALLRKHVQNQKRPQTQFNQYQYFQQNRYQEINVNQQTLNHLQQIAQSTGTLISKDKVYHNEGNEKIFTLPQIENETIQALKKRNQRQKN